MRLITNRLDIFPLNRTQVQKFLDNRFALEVELHLQHIPRTIDADLATILTTFVIPNLQDVSKLPRFFTLWLLVDRVDKTIVGSFSFKGEPNERREIEIGYGTELPFQRRGYMTEGIAAAIEWAKKQPNVDWLVADTESDNFASHKVLDKNGFAMFEQVDDILWWKIDCRTPR
jgi:[ribosomal protein S5]-alanine N-acetyltransferase